MKKRIYILILITAIFSCSKSSTKWNMTGEVSKDIQNLLEEGISRYDIMNGVRQSKRQVELNKKLKKGIASNYDWFQGYLSELNLEPGNPTPYHKNLGMTQKEYEELQIYSENIDLVSTGSMKLEIDIKDSFIQLVPIGNFEIDTIKINLLTNKVTFDEIELTFYDTIRVNDNKNAFGSSWYGYQWRLEPPIDSLNLHEINSLEIYQYKFTIGYFDQIDKSYIELKGREAKGGKRTKDFNYPLTSK